MPKPLDDVLETAPAGFFTFDDNGTILATNHRLRERLGYEPGEMEGLQIEAILSVGGKVFYHTHFFPLLKMQSLAEEFYFSFRSKGGDEVPMLVNAVRLQREGRTVNDCVVIMMKQRRKYEDELLRAKKAAETASAAKEKFLSMMSHDLRTPLQAIGGYADVILLGMHGEVNAEQREDLQLIKTAAQEMHRLINDILGFAQLESGRVEVNLQPMSVDVALDRSEQLLRARFSERTLSFDRQHCRLSVSADPDRLQQVLLNILTNAIKFTPPGGRIWITCEQRDSEVLIHIHDTGVGIPGDKVKDIFEPFVQVSETVRPSDHGVGLGLAISRDLTRAMGGDLSVESEPGQGSTFTVTLPAAAVTHQREPR